MFARDRAGIRSGLPTLLVCLVVWRGNAAAARPVRIVPADSGGSAVARAVATAQDAAAEKLGADACRQVFSDFRDRGGTSLQEKLDALGLDAATLLRSRILFYDGDRSRTCASREILAYTSPEAFVVFVCSTQFVLRTHRDPGLAAAVLIHEELHALGLFENPPASQEITARVIARCGK